MYSIKPLPEFTTWLDDRTDRSWRGVIAARFKCLALALMDDVEPVGEGVSELRIHHHDHFAFFEYDVRKSAVSHFSDAQIAFDEMAFDKLASIEDSFAEITFIECATFEYLCRRFLAGKSQLIEILSHVVDLAIINIRHNAPQFG